MRKTLFILLILASCCIQSDTGSYDAALETGDPALCEKIEDSSLRDECYCSLAEEGGNKSLCSKIGNATRGDGCYTSLARSLSDSSLCDRVSMDDLRDECFRFFLGKTRDPGFCAKMTPEKQDMCYLKTAVDLWDDGLCRKVKNDSLEQTCQAIVSGRLSGCSRLENQSAECYLLYAFYRGDPVVCESLNSSLRDKCFLDLAIKEEIPLLCTKIIKEREKDTCFCEVSKDSAACARLT